MRRIPLAIAAASTVAVAVALPASASATEVQIGQTATALVAPTCPSGTSATNCTILLTEMTGLETLSDGTASPEVIKQPGDLSSFSVGISAAAKQYVSSLDKTYGGDPEVELTVLRPIGTGATKRWQVAAEGPVEDLTNFQGDVIQYPLPQELPVVPGEQVALTTPTWAPVLSIDLSTSFSYIQSRISNCAGSSSLPNYYNPQDNLGEQSSYGCAFSKTRIEYSSTEVTTPTAAAAIRKAEVRRRGNLRPRVIKRGR